MTGQNNKWLAKKSYANLNDNAQRNVYLATGSACCNASVLAVLVNQPVGGVNR